MRSRLLTLVAVLLAVSLTAGCDARTDWAAKVGDTPVTEKQLDEWLDALAGSSTLRSVMFGQEVAVKGASASSYDMAFVDGVLGILVQKVLIDEEFDRRHLETDSETASQVQSQVLAPVKAELKDADVEVSDQFYDDLVGLFADQSALVTALGDDVQTWAGDAFSRDDIEVSSKYGTWSSGGSVSPPPGPTPAPAGS